jgi:hypothetical protein
MYARGLGSLAVASILNVTLSSSHQSVMFSQVLASQSLVARILLTPIQESVTTSVKHVPRRNTMSLKYKLFILAVLGCTLGGAMAVFAQRSETLNSDYPGFNPQTGAVICYSKNVISNGARLYCMVHGAWPENFAALEESGIIQQKLRGYQLDVIDPDDSSLDFAGDVTYRYIASSDQVSISWLDPAGRPAFETLSKKPASVSELLSRVDLEERMDTAELLGNLPLLRSFALMGMIRRGHADFVMLNGREPANWSELAASGLTGLDQQSALPLNGKLLDGTGKPGGLRIGPGTSGSFAVTLIASDGKPHSFTLGL